LRAAHARKPAIDPQVAGATGIPAALIAPAIYTSSVDSLR
jgi:hypothetical protein